MRSGGLCDQDIPVGMLMCPEHWGLVPVTLRRAINAVWAYARQRGTGVMTPGYRELVRAAEHDVIRALGVPDASNSA